jgi:hypothetical protein
MRLALPVVPVKGRTTGSARQWLGMKAAIVRISVLGGALITQFKIIQGRIRAIVR